MILLIGNWKMAPEKNTQAVDFAKKTQAIARTYKKKLSVIVCPSFIHIPTVVRQTTTLGIGAQSVAPGLEIASTGEVSAAMLKSYGVGYCIVGHSESRAQGATNDTVREQVLRLLEKKIAPILCIGEKERDVQGWYLSTIKEQLESALGDIPKASLKNLVIAYEPIWAIGSHALREATPDECQEMIIYIRKVIADMHGDKAASSVHIIYGGSVNDTNAADFITSGKAQGMLVGRVSLDAKRFAKVAHALASL